MPGRISVITCRRIYKLLPRVSVGGGSLLDRTLQWHFSNFGIGTPLSVPSLCPKRLLTESGTRTVSGNMAIRTRFILIAFFSSCWM